MKRLLLLLTILLLVGSVSATRLTFQNPEDFVSQVAVQANVPPNPAIWTVGWQYNTTGGNSYVYSLTNGFSHRAYFYNAPPGSQTLYAAATDISATTEGHPYIVLLDADGSTVMYEYWTSANKGPSSVGRYEVYIDSDSKARVYKDGILQDVSGALARNPTYVGFGVIVTVSATHAVNWDNYVYGSDNAGFIFGMPQNPNYFILKKDLANPANRGFAFANNGTVIDAHYLWSNFAKANALNESLVMQNYGSGQVVSTYYPGTAMYSNDFYWNLDTAIFSNPAASYGLYVIKSTNASCVLPSATIEYLGYGATVSFDAAQYVPLDTATVTWNILGGGYWDPATYDYKLAIRDAYGNFVSNNTVSAQTGAVHYIFKTSDQQGVYYAIMLATPKGGGEEVWMATDYANLAQYAAYTGCINDDQTASVIAGATYNFSQAGVTQSGTAASGCYNVSGFLTGANITINVSASLHHSYVVQIVPMVARNNALNITVNKTSPLFSGIAIGGVARTGMFSNGFVTGGYGEPIAGSTVTVTNATTSESYTTTTNNAGYYLFDYSNSALVSGRPYNVTISKLGYSTQSYSTVAP